MTTGSYQYIDANGLLQTVNYVADPVNGFRVAGTNLPVGPAALAAPEVAPLVAPTFNPEPLVAPVFTGVAPEPVQDTPEVAAAKAEHLALLAAAERKRRDADEEAVVAAPAIAALPYPYAAGLNLAGLPAAGLPLNYAGIAGVAGVPALTYAAAPAVAAPVATVAAAPAPLAAAPAIAAPVAYAGAPARDATLTTIKLNPGHATFYRVD